MNKIFFDYCLIIAIVMACQSQAFLITIMLNWPFYLAFIKSTLTFLINMAANYAHKLK